MSSETREKLITTTLELMRLTDPNHLSVRQIAEATGIQPSVVYHHFPDKDKLLFEAFLLAQRSIREALMALPPEGNARKLLAQRMRYHFDNAHFIVPMLRYFMAFKQANPDQPGGHIPEQAYLHIKQVIDLGMEQGVYYSNDAMRDAQVVVHALNGFVLEHYPMKPAQTAQLVRRIKPFIERALTNRKEPPSRVQSKV